MRAGVEAALDGSDLRRSANSVGRPRRLAGRTHCPKVPSESCVDEVDAAAKQASEAAGGPLGRPSRGALVAGRNAVRSGSSVNGSPDTEETVPSLRDVKGKSEGELVCEAEESSSSHINAGGGCLERAVELRAAESEKCS